MTTHPAQPEAPDARTVVRQLIGASKRVPPALHDAIVALGRAAVPPLLDILLDESLQLSAGPGEGWAPVAATGLLCELQAVEAIEPMLGLLIETDFLDILHDSIIQGLCGMGAPVLEPALAAYARVEDTDARTSIMSILGRLGVKDERIFAILMEWLPIKPDLTAGVLAEYDDPAALPALMRAFDNLPVDDGRASLFSGHAFIEIKAAIEELGGDLTPSQLAKHRRSQAPADAIRKELLDALERPSAPRLPPKTKPGRNEPCWCGSCKKYKKCHLDVDTTS